VSQADHSIPAAVPAENDERDDRRFSLDLLYRRYAPWLTARLKRRFGDAAEDLVQETYIRVAPYGERVEIRHPKALLMHIATNVVIDEDRRRKRQPVLFSVREDPGGRDGQASGGQTELVLLKQVILSMPPHLRDVFMLSRFGGLSYDGIADRLGLPVKTVEWRMSKALAYCKTKIRD